MDNFQFIRTLIHSSSPITPASVVMPIGRTAYGVGDWVSMSASNQRKAVIFVGIAGSQDLRGINFKFDLTFRFGSIQLFCAFWVFVIFMFYSD
jgi:hypothetical protein